MKKYSVSVIAIFVDFLKMPVWLEWQDGDLAPAIMSDELGQICDGMIIGLMELGEVKIREVL